MSSKKGLKSVIAAAVIATGVVAGTAAAGIILPQTNYVNITCYGNNGAPVYEQRVRKNSAVVLPTPERDGFNFDGWYLNEDMTDAVTYGTKFNKNTKVYAGWELTADALADDPTTLAETTGITKIGAGAFKGCTGLTEITIPETVTSIGAKAFEGCTNLKTVYFNATNCADFAMGQSPFNKVGVNKIIFGKNVERVPAYCMLYGSSDANNDLTKVEFLGNKVKEIGTSAFMICRNLTSITLPTSVTTIKSGAFNSTGLTSLKLPASVTTIETYGADVKVIYIEGSLYNKFTSSSAYGNLASGKTDVYVKTSVEQATRNTYFLEGSNFYYNETVNGYVHFVSDSTRERKLTVSYRNSSGTEISNEAVRYRASAKYAPEISSAREVTSAGAIKIVGWFTELNNVTTEATLTNITQSKNVYQYKIKYSFGACTWSEIKQVSDNHWGSGCFAVGDEKRIALTDGTYLTIQIADFDHDRSSYGNTIGITCVTKELLPSKYDYVMNNSSTNTGGWSNCSLRTYLNNTIYGLLPSDLQSAITTASKATTAGGASTDMRGYTSDKLFLLSCIEINLNATSAGYNQEGTPYALYANWPTDSSGVYERAKYYADSGAAGIWWLRSPHTGTTERFWCVYSSYADVLIANNSRALCFAFCV